MASGGPQSLKQRAYDELRARIERGELKEGEKVVELSVCDSLGVSRTPVREALIQLEADGYLEGIPRRGFRVRSFDEASAREVFEMLGPLDGRAALLAVPNMGPDDLADMRFLYESMELAIALLRPAARVPPALHRPLRQRPPDQGAGRAHEPALVAVLPARRPPGAPEHAQGKRGAPPHARTVREGRRRRAAGLHPRRPLVTRQRGVRHLVRLPRFSAWPSF
jgi:DNA-binding transcriptional MocR family regulator